MSPTLLGADRQRRALECDHALPRNLIFFLGQQGKNLEAGLTTEAVSCWTSHSDPVHRETLNCREVSRILLVCGGGCQRQPPFCYRIFVRIFRSRHPLRSKAYLSCGGESTESLSGRNSNAF